MKILVAFAGTIENSGGMQNVCIQFINEMIRRAHQVAVAWYGPLNAHTFYPMSQEVRIFTLLPEGAGANKPYHDVGKDISLGNKIVREGLRAFSRKKYREWNDRCKKEIIAPKIRKVIAEYKPDIIISPNQDMTFYLSNNHEDIPIITMLHNTPHYIFPIAMQMKFNRWIVAPQSKSYYLLMFERYRCSVLMQRLSAYLILYLNMI